MMENGSRSRSGPFSRFITNGRIEWSSLVTHRRYIWESFKKGVINREVYDYCIKNKYADKNLIAMWKKVRLNHQYDG